MFRPIGHHQALDEDQLVETSETSHIIVIGLHTSLSKHLGAKKRSNRYCNQECQLLVITTFWL